MTEPAILQTLPVTPAETLAPSTNLAPSENCFTYGSFVLLVDRLLEVTHSLDIFYCFSHRSF